MPYNKKDAEQFLQRVIEKLDKASVKLKYNDSTYQIADIPKEVDEELLDLIGWPLLEVLRVREVLMGKLARTEEIYWDKFFTRQTDEFLIQLFIKLVQEINKRESIDVVPLINLVDLFFKDDDNNPINQKKNEI